MSRNRFPVKSAAAYLKTNGTLQDVKISNVRPITHNLCAISFIKDEVRLDGTYNVDNANVMDALLHELAGFDVFVTVSPDSSEDSDGFPSVDAARAVDPA